ncbi:MAG: SDR family oxidoreductase [Candidatus Hydrogenedentes bacterium]|nr:SDR family oxidoreductase [Candidatus Hydrogenedentota bacterium]
MATCLVTGGAGFIGSNLVRALLDRGYAVRVLDDLSTGHRANLDGVASRIDFLEGSICDAGLVAAAMDGVTCCFHQAAVPSVPRSISDPVTTNRVNIEGSIHVFLAARNEGVRRVVYASSSSVYGNAETSPVHENLPTQPISPYGVSKAATEHYARVFSTLFGMDIVGLRYFNVFGPRQDPGSQYAAVIPIFINRMLRGERPPVHGNGRQSRDFSYIDNVVEANIRACEAKGAIAGVYNAACGAETSILGIVALLNDIFGTKLEPLFEAARKGDISRSCADITGALQAFGYKPQVTVGEGLKRTVDWYRKRGPSS